ncbi:unnamed protein product [Fusarium graminearum]|nr:unnamed protein product [Fusarium graminearum]
MPSILPVVDKGLSPQSGHGRHVAAIFHRVYQERGGTIGSFRPEMTGIEYSSIDSLTETGPYGDLEIACYHSRRVPDPADIRLQEIYEKPDLGPSCQAFLAVKTASHPSPSQDEVYLPAEC